MYLLPSIITLISGILIFGPTCSDALTCKDPAWLTQFVDRHNVLRARHNVSQHLTLNATTSAYAQEWADNLLAIGYLQHRTQYTYGENLYSMWDPRATPLGAVHVVNNWYGEITKYEKYWGTGKEPDMSTFEQWGHFTPIIWKATTSIGIGCAISPYGQVTYIVANYYPQGNIVGQFRVNVPPPIATFSADDLVEKVEEPKISVL